MRKTYNEFMQDILNGLIDTDKVSFLVCNSDDNTKFIYHNGELVSSNNKNKSLKDLYRYCDLNGITLETISDSPTSSTKINFTDDYYTLDNFFNLGNNETADINEKDEYVEDEYEILKNQVYGIEEDEDEDEDDEDKTEAIQAVIKMLEMKYMDLDMEIDACQGCMEDLDKAFHILQIYQDLIKFLGGDLEKDKAKITDEWFKQRREEDEAKQREKDKRDSISKDIHLKMLSLAHSDKAVVDALRTVYEKVNYINDLIIELKNSK